MIRRRSRRRKIRGSGIWSVSRKRRGSLHLTKKRRRRRRRRRKPLRGELQGDK
jgi:hypothetical protein